jgi:hypothetical protein
MRIIAVITIINLFVLPLRGQTEEFITLKYSELQKLSIELPYIRFYGEDSTLLVFGSNHTNNFHDPQVNMICSLIYSFKPTVVLYEGDGIASENTKKETIENYFEMGLTKYLADSLNILSVNIEPRTQDKYKFLLTKYQTDDIMIATLGLQISLLQINNENFENIFPSMINDLCKEGLNLTKKQKTLPYFYKLYRKKFGKSFTYENFDSREIQAKYDKTVFNKINQMANEFRDQHIISLTKSYLNKKERVFLIEGGWHAIVCEPAYKLIAK